MAEVTIDRRVSRPVKFDDRPGRVSELGARYGIQEHQMSPSNKRFVEMIHKTASNAPCYFVDRNDAQLMATGQSFFVQKTTLGKARDAGYWIVGVGDEAGGSAWVGLLKQCADSGEQVPKRRWPHNAYRCED